MSKRSVFTSVTPLPPYITRETVIETLHQHSEMIELNPLVIKHGRCKPPPNAPADEFHCIWYELTDKVHYLPGGILSGNVSYKACFHDLPQGLQTHVYAPTGLEIKEKWSVGGNMPGEPREPLELGLTDAPREGLYLREDVDMRCNILATNFVRRTLKKAHSVLVERLIVKADIIKQRSSYNSSLHRQSIAPSSAYAPTETTSYRDSMHSPTSHTFQFSSPDMISPTTARPMSQDELHFQGRGSNYVLEQGNSGIVFPPHQKTFTPEIDGTPINLPEIKVEHVDTGHKDERRPGSIKHGNVAAQP